MRVIRSTFLGLCCAMLSFPAAAQPAQAPGKAVLHLVAPTLEDSGGRDVLMEEASLRLASAKLALQGVYAPYWAGDPPAQGIGRLYPRIEVGASTRPQMAWLRVERKGALFLILASGDGKSFLEVGRTGLKLPPKLRAGVFAPTVSRPSGLTAMFSDLLLNGAPALEGWDTVQLGQPTSPGVVERAGNRWTFRTGKSSEGLPGVDQGVFLCRELDGDFTLQMKVESVKFEGSFGFVGVLARATLDAGSALMGGASRGTFPDGLIREPGCPDAWAMGSAGIQELRLTLRSAPGRTKDLGPVVLSCQTWPDLEASVERLTAAILAGAREVLPAKARPVVKAVEVSPDQRKRLAAARAQVLSLSPGSILSASREVDAVLNAAPTCAEAHYTAVLCGALLACQELSGVFHARDRFLAGPFAYWMLAQSLAAPVRSEDCLSGAWLMLACGYPNAARDVADRLDPALAEVKALRMFATRDYRPLTEKSVLQAMPVEQLAWLWAVQDCDRTDLLLESSPVLAAQKGSCAFLPLYNSYLDVELGHATSEMGMRLVVAGDARDLLCCEDLTTDVRLAVAKRLAAAVGIPLPATDNDVPGLARRIATAVMQHGVEEDLSSLIRAMSDLYKEALAVPSAPVAAASGLQWRSLPLHDYADLQRGLFINAFYLRAGFMAHSWGVMDAAHEFCEEVAKGFSDLPHVHAYFRLYSSACLNNLDFPPEILTPLQESPWKAQPATLYTLAHTVPYVSLRRLSHLGLCPTPGRGCWDWGRSAFIVGRHGQYDEAYSRARLAMDADDGDVALRVDMAFLMGNMASVADMAERVTYHYKLLEIAADWHRTEKRVDAAAAVFRRIVDLAPNEVGSYYDYATLYADAGRRAEAIEIAEKAVANCKYSVGLSNLMGQAAEWLAAENRPVEALAWGQRAAQSGSASGMNGLATALEANGRREEALAMRRVVAHRYAEATRLFIESLITFARPAEEVRAEVQALLREHATLQDTVLKEVTDAFQKMPGAPRALALLYGGPLASVAPEEQKRMLRLCALGDRDSDLASESIRALASLKRPSGDDLLWACLAGMLNNGKPVLDGMEEQLAARVRGDMGPPCIRYALGKLPLNALLEQCTDPTDKCWAWVFMGMDAERRGDNVAAAKAYQSAAALDVKHDLVPLAARWAARVAPPPAQSSPAAPANPAP